jgi:hypothetical protein
MSFDGMQLSDHPRRTVERLRTLAVAGDAAATAGKPRSVRSGDGDTAIDTLAIGYGGTPPATARVTVTAAIQGFSDGNAETNRPSEGRASHPIGRTSALRTRANSGPKSNEPTSVGPTRRDDAAFEHETTPTQGWHPGRGDSPWT